MDEEYKPDWLMTEFVYNGTCFIGAIVLILIGYWLAP